MKCPYCKSGLVTEYHGGFPNEENCEVCDGTGELGESPIPYLASIAASLSSIAKDLDTIVDKSGKYLWVRKAW